MKLLDAAAAVFNRRAALLELAGAGCFVAAAAQVSAVLALVVAGACLVLKSAEIDRRKR